MLIRFGFLGRLGGSAIGSAKTAVAFALNILGLSDAYGNIGTFTRAGVANVVDYTGTLVSVPTDVHRVSGGRYTGGVWYDTDSAGNPLHPKRIINGQSTYLDVRKYATATVVPAGGSMEDAGRWYTSALGGTTAGATLLADVGVTDWVDKGIYNRSFGVLLEGGITNRLPSAAVNDLTNPSWIKRGAIVVTKTHLAPSGTMTGDTVSIGAVGIMDLLIYATVPLNSLYIPSFYIFPITSSGIIALSNPAGKVGGDCAIDLSMLPSNKWSRITASNPAVTVITAFNASLMATCGLHLKSKTGTTLKFAMWGSSVVAGELLTSFIDGIRQNELGNLKFPTTAGWKGKNAFPHAAGTMLLSMVMPMDLIARGNTNAGIVTTDGIGLLYRGWTQALTSFDGVNYSGTFIPINYYIAGDTMQFAVTWDAALPHFRLSYRNATTGLVWTHTPWVAYGGNFVDTGMYQFFANSTEGGTVRNNIILNKALTDIEVQGYVIP